MSSRRQNLVVLLVTGIIALVFWQPVVADPDMWGHVLFGQQFVHEPGLPETNGYSFIAGDHPWHKHEWAFQALMGLAWDAGSGRGLVVLKGICILLLLAILVPGLHRRRDTEATCLLLLGVVALVNMGMLVRPQLATFILVAFTMRLLEGILRGSVKAAWLAVLPPVFVAWVNLHGGFLVGLGLIGLSGCLVGLALIAPRRSVAPASGRLLGALVVTFTACVVATFLHPDGLELWRFLAVSITGPPTFVTEWYPLIRRLESPHVPVFLAVLVLALGLLLSRRPFVLSLAGCAFAVFAFATFFSIRHLPLAAIAGSLALADALPDALERFRRARPSLAWRRGLHAALGVMALASLLRPLPALLDGPLWLRVPDGAFPEEAVDAALAGGLEGNMVVLYDWGCYVLFRAHPAIRVDVDSRCDTAYPMALLEETVAAKRSREAGRAMLERVRPDHVLMPPAIMAEWGLAEDPAWRVVHADDVAVLVTATPRGAEGG